MEKEFVPYDIALAMKELGFDESCVAHYRDKETLTLLGYGIVGISYSEFKDEGQVLAPLYQQAFRWFREKYNIDARFHTYTHHKEGVRTDWMWDYIDGKKTSFDGHEKSDKEAQDACLRKLIEIVEENL